ncbi:14743_t:CDS:2, partial [Gigaspora rosea]
MDEKLENFFMFVGISDKKVYLSKRCNPRKDYFDHIQSTGEFKELDETFEICTRREALEEANLELKELFFVCFRKGFKQFQDRKECLYKTAIYFTILKLKHTPSIESNLKRITEAIYAKFRRRPTKKCKLENTDIVKDNPSSISFPIEEVEKEILADPRMAYEIKVIQGDNGIDIIVSYKKNIILIQCKKIEKAITFDIIQKFERSISQFSDPLGIIVYNNFFQEKEDKQINNIEYTNLKFDGKMVIKKNSSNQSTNLTNYHQIIQQYFEISEKRKLSDILDSKEELIEFSFAFAGAIGLDKTTIAKHFERYLKDEGYKVYRMTKVSMLVPDALEIFYDTKNALFFQQVFINKYKEVVDEINKIDNCDYIIIDRGFKEIKIFTEGNIKDEKIKDYLRKQFELIKLKYHNDVIYVKPEKETVIKRKKSRNQFWKN